MITRILIGGEGGQGVQAIAKVLIHAAHASGKHVAHLPNFGVEQRGGVSLAFVQIGDEEISYPKFREADVAVLLSHRSVERSKMHIGTNTKIIFDNSIIGQKELLGFRTEKIAIPASHLAKEKLIPRVFNMIVLGALTEEIGGIKEKELKKATLNYFNDKIKKKHELKHFNLAALEMGEKTIKGLRK
ncbi:MAG: 2-oxoacid:acceptor oxidoreductase family protein [Patescibacteria group bacterium]|nr:2-oxoacid:acceptor oxidoreductase family protein [Patescibacteria group bacterium]